MQIPGGYEIVFAFIFQITNVYQPVGMRCLIVHQIMDCILIFQILNEKRVEINFLLFSNLNQCVWEIDNFPESQQWVFHFFNQNFNKTQREILYEYCLNLKNINHILDRP
jgi:hypothetical protein